jgi:hypothetical protein
MLSWLYLQDILVSPVMNLWKLLACILGITTEKLIAHLLDPYRNLTVLCTDAMVPGEEVAKH